MGTSKLHSASLDWITPNAERTVAVHARVSTKDPHRDEATKLLNYCIKHGHWSVFEQVCAAFEIITTRAISPQILRHRSFTFQESSQRYCDPLDVLEDVVAESPYFELRAQDKKNRQNSYSFENEPVIELEFRDRIVDLFVQSQKLYEEMLAADVAKESARNILCLCVPTRLHMMGTLRSWIFYVGLRAAPGTQAEHRIIAQEIGTLLDKEMPIIKKSILVSLKETPNNALLGWNYV